jgi:hypothetical protein
MFLYYLLGHQLACFPGDVLALGLWDLFGDIGANLLGYWGALGYLDGFRGLDRHLGQRY